MQAVRRLAQIHEVPPWGPSADATQCALKRSLRRYRREEVLPRLLAAGTGDVTKPPLPWAWIAAHAGRAFSQPSFELWWQLRALGKPYPSCSCPWCSSGIVLDQSHLQEQCPQFAQGCWCAGIRPEEAFCYPCTAQWFVGVLGVISELYAEIKVHGRDRAQFE